MTHAPHLTQADVRNWTDERFVERGRRYYAEGRIRHPRRQGQRLQAECIGSQPTPYRVEVTLGEDGIRSAHCSCPMGAGGRCKHVVALLLTWINKPETFTETQTLQTLLQQRSKDQLITLIQRMIDRHPDLETLINLAVGRDAGFDAETFRRRIEQTIEEHGGYDYEYGYGSYGYGSYDLARDLEPFVAHGDDYADAGDWETAIHAYRITAEAILDHYEAYVDEEGELGHVVNTCVERLGDLLVAVEEAELREQILRVLFEVYHWDVEYGGIAIGDAVPSIILNQAPDAERHQVADWIREALPDASEDNAQGWAFNPRTGERIALNRGEWKQRILGSFLLDLEADRLDDEAFLAICQQTGRLDDLVDRLLDLDRLDEALDALRHASDYDLYRLADRFVEHGAATEIRDLVQTRLDNAQDPDRRLVGWLRDYAATHDDHEAALTLSKRLFWAVRSPEAYRSVRTHALALDRWTEERTALLDRLREAEQFDLLTRLHLAEDNVDAALRTVHQAGGGWYGSTQGLKLEVARAAEAPHPERAIELYLEVAGDLIDQRGRKNYAQAAEHLARIKQICTHRSNMTQWSELIATIREEYSNLPALQDELDKAGL